MTTGFAYVVTDYYLSVIKVAYEVGNMELLRETREWEVGLGMIKDLEVLLLDGNYIDSFPPQLERLTALKRLQLDRNRVRDIIYGIMVDDISNLGCP